MVVRMPYGGGIPPPEHHSESYEALFLNTPGFKVVVPSNPYDAKGLLIAAIRDEDPVLFMEPKRIYRAFREAVPAESYTVPIGKAAVGTLDGAARYVRRHVATEVENPEPGQSRTRVDTEDAFRVAQIWASTSSLISAFE